MLRRLLLSTVLVSALLPGGRASAEPTLELRVSGPGEIFEGDPESASLDARGTIGMGPVLTPVVPSVGAPVTTLRAGASAIYAGTAGAGLIEVDAAGKTRTLLPSEKGLITAIEVHDGAVHAATSPDGAIVRVGNDGSAKTLFDPSEKYVWAMVSGPKVLYVATGEPGHVLEVDAAGKSKVLFDPEETHVRSLIRHPKRGLIAGSGQKGVIYEIGEDGTAHALYDSGMEEVTAFAVDPASGDLFCAIISETKTGAVITEKSIPAVGEEPKEAPSPIKGSEVIRISASGHVDVLWTSRREGALGLAFDPRSKRLYVAAGAGGKGRGRVYAIDPADRDRVLLVSRLEPSLATGVVLAPTGGAVLVGTSPAGQILRVGPGMRAESVYVTSEQDLGRIARLGRVWFDADVPEGARVEVSIRTGNTRSWDKTWSDWSAAVKSQDGGEVKVPEGHYAQLRARLIAAGSGAGPRVKSLHASLVRMNVAPTVKDVFLLRRGVYMKPMPPEEDQEKTVTVSASMIQRLRDAREDDDKQTRVRQGKAPGMMTVSWTAEDTNGDDLLARLELRRVDLANASWKKLADAVPASFYSFDSRAYPDGKYQVRVKATDRPSNPPDQALSDTNASEPFTIDNTPPSIGKVSAKALEKKRIRVEAEAEDVVSLIGNAEVSVDGGPWLMLPSTDGLIDAKKERFAVELSTSGAAGEPEIASGAHTVLVRITDDAGNLATASAAVDLP